MSQTIVLNKILFFIDLKLGNIFLGWLGAIVYLALSIFWIRELALYYYYGPSEVIHILMVIISLIHVIDCVLFVTGICQRNKLLILPWLFGQILLTIIFSVSYGIFYSTLEFLSLTINWIVFQAYIWVCAYSIYYKISTGSPEYEILLGNNQSA